MTEPKFKMGEMVYYAQFHAHRQKRVTCPDCNGTGRIRLILHDEEQVAIPCEGCSVGYDPPTGKIGEWGSEVEVGRYEIIGMDIQPDGIRYTLRGPGYNYAPEEDRLFSNKGDAEAKAQELADEFVKRENARILEKEKPHKTWAWHASYHRKQIKEAQKKIEYHTKKLNAANLKKKGGVR